MFNKSGPFQCARRTPGTEGELGLAGSRGRTADAGHVLKQVLFDIFTISGMDPRLLGVDINAQQHFKLARECCQVS